MTIKLITAAANGDINVVYAELGRRGINIDFQENLYGNTALHCALKCGHNNVANLLLHYRASINIPDKLGFTANDIYNGTYHNAMDNLFMQNQLEDSTDLIGQDYCYLNDNYSNDFN